ncbi:hypothetical protein FA95DRAFT_626637 [Auriscalpium vulgare]|uniref:Uncharacterized protein n=1 Tax=Auriscalpium vulgare TaxID=40419 RepID=A0ACB8RDP4_9AGAM|nr:hypothetical protein FA95DRAFT_626637 [Auriscalpium vulgare]
MWRMQSTAMRPQTGVMARWMLLMETTVRRWTQAMGRTYVNRSSAHSRSQRSSPTSRRSASPSVPHTPRSCFPRYPAHSCVISLRTRFCKPVHMQHCLLATVSEAAPHLRSLALANVTPVAGPVYSSPAFHAALNSLTHLSIATASYRLLDLPLDRDSITTRAYIEFCKHTVNENILGHADGVVSLTLVNDAPAVAEAAAFPITCETVVLPRLKYLVLKSPWFERRHWAMYHRPLFMGLHDQLERINMIIGVEEEYWVRPTNEALADEFEFEEFDE